MALRPGISAKMARASSTVRLFVSRVPNRTPLVDRLPASIQIMLSPSFWSCSSTLADPALPTPTTQMNAAIPTTRLRMVRTVLIRLRRNDFIASLQIEWAYINMTVANSVPSSLFQQLAASDFIHSAAPRSDSALTPSWRDRNRRRCQLQSQRPVPLPQHTAESESAIPARLKSGASCPRQTRFRLPRQSSPGTSPQSETASAHPLPWPPPPCEARSHASAR